MSLASGLTDNSGAARADAMAGRRGSSGAAAEETKAEGGPGRLTAENLAALGSNEQAEALEEMRRKYAIQTLADA